MAQNEEQDLTGDAPLPPEGTQAAPADGAESSAAAGGEKTAAGQEPPIFGGRNPSKADWFATREPEPVEEEPAEAMPEQAEELESLLPSREKRQAIARELVSPFAVLLFFILSLLVGISTVNVSIPESATVRAKVHYQNYRQLMGTEVEEFQVDQDRLLRSYETRSLLLNQAQQLPGGAMPSFATDDLEFHHRLDRHWEPEGELTITLESEDPQVDARRLSLLVRAMIVISSRSKQHIAEAEAEIKSLQQRRAQLAADFAHMRDEIAALEPAALKQTALAEAATAMQQYLSLLEPLAPQRVAAEQNLERLRGEATAAREAGEKRDALLVRHMQVQRQMDEADQEIVRQRQAAAKVVYPLPLAISDVTVSDLRPEHYNLLWIVTLGISAVFVVLLILSFVRRAAHEVLEQAAERRRQEERGGLPQAS